MRTTAFCALFLALATVAIAADEGPADVHLDTTFEQPDQWRLVEDDPACRAVGRLEIRLDAAQTHGTPKSLLMAWNKNLGDLGGTGIHMTPIAHMGAAKFPDDLDLSQYTSLKFWAKMAGTRHGGFCLCIGNQPRMWGKGVKRTFAHAPLDVGDWSEYLLPIGHADAKERKDYRWLVIGCANMGHFPDEASVMKTWVDDFVLTAEPMRKWQGWDADPTVVIVSQLGFRRFHEKLAIVGGKEKAREFMLRDESSGAEACKGGWRGSVPR